MRAAVYLRVSTDGQDSANQLPDVTRLVEARGYELARTFTETGSSAAKKRPVLDEMLAAAHRAEFSVLVVWAIDRLGRTMAGNLALILDLDRRGVRVVSVRESWLEADGPVRPLLISIFSWIAEQERARIGERTRAGLARARAQGRELGRPRRWVNLDRARELRASGASLRAVATELGLSETVLRRALAREACAEIVTP